MALLPTSPTAMRAPRWAPLVAASFLVASCGEQELTQIVVGIDTELCEAGDGDTPEFDRVDVNVDGADPVCAVVDRDEDGCVRVSSADFPLRLPLLSESGSGNVAVRVELRMGATVVGCGRGNTTFSAGETQRFYGVVPRPCAEANCNAMVFTDLTGDPEEPFADAIVCEPPPPVPQTPIRRIAAGDGHACLVDGAGDLYCWGANGSGQLGLGDLRNRTRPTPVAVGAGRSVEHIEGGRAHTCAVIANGPSRTVSCWGANTDGQVGNGEASEAAVASPVTVPGTSGAREVALGPSHSCARFEDGVVRCWGSNQAGESSGTPGENVLAPVAVPMVMGATALGAGGNNPAPSLRHSCAVGAVDATNAVWCWGSNEQGQLGGDGMSPITFSDSSLILQVALGARESCASAESDELICWGFNAEPGTLGFPVTGVEERTAPEVVGSSTVLAPVTSTSGPRLATLAAGDSYRCFLDGDARPVCVGNNAEGRLGSSAANTATPVAVEVPAGIRFSQIAVGGSFGCALPEDGSLPFCWGSNREGQIGDGSAGGAVSPQRLLECD